MLVLPLEAIKKEKTASRSSRRSSKTDRKRHARREAVEVTIGLRNDHEVEVSGIAEGTKVLLKPDSSAANEAKM